MGNVNEEVISVQVEKWLSWTEGEEVDCNEINVR